jgi:hypothetical protein
LHGGRRIEPYFQEEHDWQYVSAILEATLRERLKFERSWIMRACRGAGSLADVQRNIKRDLETAKGLNESVLTTLHAYLELVLPQIEGTRFASAISLASGLNVMDLSGFSLEMQSLIIRSSLEWVYHREVDTVVVIPEAWEFIPESRGGPVKYAAEQLIRKGAASRNYVWCDSQDIAGVSKVVLRQVGVWILGVQREANEVKRMLAHIPNPKPKPDDVMQLSLGEFFVCHGKQLKRVYVQPVWLDKVAAQKFAKSNLRDSSVIHRAEAKAARSRAAGLLDEIKKLTTPNSISRTVEILDQNMKEDEVYREQYEQEHARVLKLEDALAVAKGQIAELRVEINRLTGMSRMPPAGTEPQHKPNLDGISSNGLDEIYQYIRRRLELEPAVIELLVRKPELRVSVRRPVIEVDDSTLKGRLAVLVADGFFDEARAGNAAYVELQRRGFSTAKPNVYRELDKLAELGIVTKEANGFQKAPDAIVTAVVPSGERGGGTNA